MVSDSIVIFMTEKFHFKFIDAMTYQLGCEGNITLTMFNALKLFTVANLHYQLN